MSKRSRHSNRANNLGLNRRWKRMHTALRLRGTVKNRAERRAPKRAAWADAQAQAAALAAAAQVAQS
jgi:hypothetical protein